MAALRITLRASPSAVLRLVEVTLPIRIARSQPFVAGVALFIECLFTIGAADGLALTRDAAVGGALWCLSGTDSLAIRRIEC